MEATSFENLIISGDVCKNFIEITCKIIVVCIILMLILKFISNNTSININIPIMWYINIPKIIVSSMAVIFVFFYNYSTKKIQMPEFNDMLMSTFLVGILALIELLTSVATVIKDVCDAFNKE